MSRGKTLWEHTENVPVLKNMTEKSAFWSDTEGKQKQEMQIPLAKDRKYLDAKSEETTIVSEIHRFCVTESSCLQYNITTHF